jgi:hypothetical protein
MKEERDKTILYLAMKVKKWGDMKFNKDIFRISVAEGDYGYCPVFDDYEKAVEVAGGKEYVIMINKGRDLK